MNRVRVDFDQARTGEHIVCAFRKQSDDERGNLTFEGVRGDTPDHPLLVLG